MRTFQVYINGESAGTVEAAGYALARKAARKLFRVSCDIIG